MRLYATTTSERASKGQGGNNYLDIKIQDEKQRTVADITVLPKEQGKLENKTRLFVRYNSGAYLIDSYVEKLKQTKGEKKKGEIMPTRATDGEWDEHN